jgi:hypothetical protein
VLAALASLELAAEMLVAIAFFQVLLPAVEALAELAFRLPRLEDLEVPEVAVAAILPVLRPVELELLMKVGPVEMDSRRLPIRPVEVAVALQ